jgi:hypothetical protein
MAHQCFHAWVSSKSCCSEIQKIEAVTVVLAAGKWQLQQPFSF